MSDRDKPTLPPISAPANGWFGELFSRHNDYISQVLLILLVTLPLIVISVFAIRSVHTEALVDDQQNRLNQQWVLQSLNRELQSNIDHRLQQYMAEFRNLTVSDNDLRWWMFKHPPLELVVVFTSTMERHFPPVDNQGTTVNELRLLEQLRPEFTAIMNREQPLAPKRTIVKGIEGPKLLSCQQKDEWFVCLLIRTSGLEDWVRQSLSRVALPPAHRVSVHIPGLSRPIVHPEVEAQTPSQNQVQPTKPTIRLPFEFWDMELYDQESESTNNRPLVFTGLLLPLFCLLFACGYGLYRLEKSRRQQVLAQQQFTAELAHEIRTPLANIHLYIDLIKRASSERQADYYSVIVSEVRRLSLLVDNAILLERPAQSLQSLEGPAKDPDQLILETLDIMRPLLDEQNCQVDIDLGIACKLCFDRDALQRVLINLLDNARKYAAGGQVRLVTSTEDQRIRIDYFDQGPGLPAGLWEQVQGHKTERINPGGQGFGLGLLVCLRLCRRSGGQLEWLADDDGCHFRILLPVNDQQEND